MGDSAQQLAGPDLRLGVGLTELREGEPLLGHAGGEAVLITRRGGEVWVVGATCTHYGGPLAEGLVTGETVHCPWHHACFSLRTGAALAAPALSPLPRWQTRVSDGKVYVGEKQETDPLAARAGAGKGSARRAEAGIGSEAGRAAETPPSVVIVGAGAAGSAAAEMLRREGYRGPVLLVDPDPDAPYDRPNLSKDYLAGSAPEDWLPLRPSGFLAEHGIERVVDVVTDLVPSRHEVTLGSGPSFAYGALLLATGARPIRPPIPGAERAHVHVLRSLSDCRGLIAGAAGARTVVIVGASFIGLEAAAAMRARGLAVTVVAPESVPFERTLGVELGGMLRALHEEHGVQFRLGHVVREVRQADVVLDDDTVVPADLVLLGVGVRPVLDLAVRAGLASQQGVPVNGYLETSAPGIYAAGDIALYPDPRTGEAIRVEHWVLAQRQGQAAARNILGRAQPFTDVPFFWTQHYDVAVSYVGHAREWDALAISGDAGARDCRIAYMRDGVEAAVATVNRDRASLEAEAGFAGERLAGAGAES